MSYQEFVSENEAASLVGVGPNTLSRFAEAGYLHVENDDEGVRRFSTKELEKVFGSLGDPQKRQTKKRSSPLQVPQEERPAPSSVLRTGPRPWKMDTEESAGLSPSPTVSADEETAEDFSWALSPERSPDKSPETSPEMASSLSQEGPAIEFLEREVARLKNVIELQEKVLELRDEQLQESREERDWLKRQIERLEDKMDRDQVLLLSETQILHQMLNRYTERKSALRATLEWFGIVDEKKEPRSTLGTRTIDLNSSATSSENNYSGRK